MADFNQAFSRIFESGDQREDSENIITLPYQGSSEQKPNLCWDNMRKLGFSNIEMLGYIKSFLCEEVWFAVAGDRIYYQPLAESIFSFALVNGSDHCIYLLNSVLNLKGGQELLAASIGEINSIDGDAMLLKFSMAKIIYYELSSQYKTVQGISLKGYSN